MDTIPIITFSKLIEKHIIEFKPDTIFTHSKNDLNIDHKITHDATLIATRPKKFNNTLKEILCFEILSSSNLNLEYPFNPNFFIDITNEIKKVIWFKILSKRSFKGIGRTLDQLTTLAEYGVHRVVSNMLKVFICLKKIRLDVRNY